MKIFSILLKKLLTTSEVVELSDECHRMMTTCLQTDLLLSYQCYLKKCPVALVHSNDLLCIHL